jgi:hypothetical protein
MVRVVRLSVALALVSVVGLLPGCGSGTPTPATGADRKENVENMSFDQLKQMLELWKGDGGGKPPAKVADLAKYEKIHPLAVRKLKTGEIVFFYGAPVQDSASNTVLAYEKQAPESGGYVLMGDGTTIKKMTADDFKSANKAGKEPASAK